MDKEAVIDRVREFNRFYTVMLRMLDRHFLDSEFSVTENRILFELSVGQECQANELAEKLRLDKSFMSRAIKSFEQKGLLTKRPSPKDGRAFLLRLTEEGGRVTARLIGNANRQIEGLIAHLEPDQRDRLCQAMDVITECLSGQAQDET